MFNAPETILNIPDIKKIYDINDRQIVELETAINEMEDDILLETMSEEKIKRWEAMLGIIHLNDDTLDNRRFRIRAKVLEGLPYSLRVIMRKLDVLVPEGYTLEITADAIIVKLASKSKRMIEDVFDMLENSTPLNMVLNVSIIWNQYETVGAYTYAELSQYTYKRIREEVF